MASADVDDMEFEPRTPFVGLHDNLAESVLQALQRPAAGPEMARRDPFRDLVIFGKFTQGTRHVAILAVLTSQPRFPEVIAPFQKSLGLFPHNPCTQAVTIGAH